MPITISSFHIEPDQSSKLGRIRNGRMAYLRVAISEAGQPKIHWTKYDVETGNPRVEPRLLKPRKPVGIKIQNSTTTVHHNPVEVVELRAYTKSVDSHKYEVALNDYLKRKPSKGCYIGAGMLDAIPEYYPPGTEFEIEDGYALSVFNGQSWSSSLNLDLGSLAKFLGLELGISFRTESTRRKETNQTTTHIIKRRLKLPEYDNKGVVRGRFSYKFNVCFERYFTIDDITWPPLDEDYMLLIEVLCSRPVYLTHSYGFQEQMNAVNKEKETMKSTVKKWLSHELRNAGLCSLGC